MKTFIFGLSAVTLMLSNITFAQPTTQSLTGTYVFYEEGASVSQQIASIATVNFSTGGSVAGTRYWRSPGNSYKSNLIGAYSTNPDGTLTLAMTAATMPIDGSDPVTFKVNYQLILPKSKSQTINAIRTDNGYFTIAKLIPAAAPGTLKGSFLFSEHGNGAPYVGLGQLNLDGTNNIAGYERVESIGVNTIYTLTGNYSVGSDGFGTFTLNIPGVDPDGNPTVTPTNYIFLNGADQIYAIRTDASTAFISNLSAL